MRHTKSHTGKRRSHHSLKKAVLPLCAKCGEKKFPHRVCKNCGTYKKKSILDVLKKLTKKERKKKEKDLAEKEKEQTKGKELSAEELSKK